jgi:hypothetical protein
MRSTHAVEGPRAITQRYRLVEAFSRCRHFVWCGPDFLPYGVILSAAAFQAKRRISVLSELERKRKPNCTTTKDQPTSAAEATADSHRKTGERPVCPRFPGRRLLPPRVSDFSRAVCARNGHDAADTNGKGTTPVAPPNPPQIRRWCSVDFLPF